MLFATGGQKGQSSCTAQRTKVISTQRPRYAFSALALGAGFFCIEAWSPLYLGMSWLPPA